MASPLISPSLSGDCSPSMSDADAAWSPAFLGARLVLDLNADLGITIGTGVSQWSDQSGAGNHVTQGTGSRQPTRVLNVLDGHASVRFDGSNDQLSRLDAFTGIAIGDRVYVYYLWTDRQNNAAIGNGLWSIGDTGTVNNGLAGVKHAPTHMFRKGGGSPDAGYTDGNVTTPRLMTYRMESGANQLDANNTQVASAATGNGSWTVTPDTLLIGDVDTGGFVPLKADVFRVLVVNPAPSANEHASAIAYFKQTYPSVVIA